MPSIDHFRKQAKLYLQWHRRGHYPVAAMIREILPRFAAMSDVDVLAAPFKLHDAQELVARRWGHASWSALLHGANLMTHDRLQSSEITGTEAQLLVSDMDVALAFYTGKLGFEIAFAYGEPVFYAQVARGGGCLNLRHIEGPAFTDGVREQEVLSATLTLEEAKPLFLEYESAGASFHQPLRSEPWGARTFIVRDPDGNLIAFAGR